MGTNTYSRSLWSSLTIFIALYCVAFLFIHWNPLRVDPIVTPEDGDRPFVFNLPQSPTTSTSDASRSLLGLFESHSIKTDPSTSVPASLRGTDVLIVLVTQAFFFLVGWIFFRTKLSQDSMRESLEHIQILFSITFSLSCGLFVLLLFELVDVTDRSTRLLTWQVDLSCLLALIMVGIPILFIYLAISKYINRISHRIAVTMAIYSLFIYVFVFVRSPTAQGHAPFSSLWSVAHLISRVGAVGVTSVAALSGFGAVNCPQQFLGDFLRRVDDSSLLVASRHSTLALSRLATARKRALLTALHGASDQDIINHTLNAGSGLLLSLPPQSGLCRAEAATADRLWWELTVVADHAARYEHTQTAWGRVLNTLGYVLSMFCVIKVIVCMANALRGRVAHLDPVTRVLQLIVVHVADIRIDIGYWAPLVSFCFVAILVATQMRGFLIFTAKAFRAGSRVLTSGSVLLLLTETMAIYFMSMVLLVRLHLPAQFRRVVTVALGDVSFNFYHNWFDALFAISALGTCFIFVLQHRVRAAQVQAITQLSD